MIAILVRVFSARHRRNIAILLASAVACVLIGGALFATTQHLPVTTGWYWAITTATTVGYGDVTPKNAAGRIIASATMLTTIPLLASVFALATGRAAAEGLRRIMAMSSRAPDGSSAWSSGAARWCPPSWTSWPGPTCRWCWWPTWTRTRSSAACT